MTRIRNAVPALLLLGLTLGAGGTGAQEAVPPGAIVPDPAVFEASQPFEDPALEAKVSRLARELRCPTCQALSIEDSPSDISQQMKAVIRDRLREGMTEDGVKAHFVAAYGEWILLSPTPRGFNLVVYVLPLFVLLLGLGMVVFVVRRWIPAAPGVDADLSDSSR